MKSRMHIPFLSILTCLFMLIAMPAMAGSATSQAVTGSDSPDFSLNVELTVLDGTVSAVTVYNSTGETLLTLDAQADATPQETFRSVLAQIQADGYLAADVEEPYLLITTTGGILDATLADELRELARGFMRDAGHDVEVDYTSIGADVSAKADTLGLPGGRYLMMQYIAQQQGIAVEDAIAQYGGMKVRDMMREFEGLREAMETNESGDQERLQEREREQEREQEQEQEQDQEQLQEHEQKQNNRSDNKDKSDKNETPNDNNSSKGNGKK